MAVSSRYHGFSSKHQRTQSPLFVAKITIGVSVPNIENKAKVSVPNLCSKQQNMESHYASSDFARTSAGVQGPFGFGQVGGSLCSRPWSGTQARGQLVKLRNCRNFEPFLSSCPPYDLGTTKIFNFCVRQEFKLIWIIIILFSETYL